MKKLGKRKAVVLMCTLACLIVICGEVFAAGGNQTILKLGHVMGTDIARHRAAIMMTNYVAEKTNNRIKIEVYPLAQMGGIKELQSGVQLGTVEMVILGSELSNMEPLTDILSLPYLYKDLNDAARVMMGPSAKEIFAKLEKKGVIVISASPSGIRMVTTSKTAVKTPQDMKGMTIRVPNVKVHVSTIEAMGARPIPMPFGELYLALKQGVVDGQENPAPQIETAKLYEVQKYLIKTNHIINPIFIIMNKKKFDSLSQEDRAVLTKGGELWSEQHINMLNEEDNALLKKFQDKGMTIIEPDRESFRKACAGVIDKYPNFKDIYSRITK